jgi:hypothetical protein
MRGTILMLSILFIISVSLGWVVAALATLPVQSLIPSSRHIITRRQLIIGSGLVIVTTRPPTPANAACCHNRRLAKLRDKRIATAHQQDEEEEQQRQQLISTADATFIDRERFTTPVVHSRKRQLRQIASDGTTTLLVSPACGESCIATVKNSADHN